MARILIVDDEPSVREALRMVFKTDHEPLPAADGPAALTQLAEGPVDLVLLDVVMPGMDGLEVLRAIRAAYPVLPVVMLTATRTVRTAVDAIKLGALDYLTKPFDVDELRLVVRKALAPAPQAPGRASPARRSGVADASGPAGRPAAGAKLLGEAPSTQAVRGLVEQVARRRATVLITGESGTGKEVVARAIHAASLRATGPFVAVNCAAIPETLLESELFGHERGAFTDAKAQRLGRFELAHGGTLFLDEVGELPLAAQAKLLRVLEDQTFIRVGGSRGVTVDVRVIAATNQDLRAITRPPGGYPAAHRFRDDLYYRLAVVPIRLPPLRERREDIPMLARHFLALHADELPGATFTDDALALLTGHDWPGNVRELQNVVERAVALAKGPAIGLDDLPVHLAGERPLSSLGSLREAVLGGELRFDDAEAEFERELILDALRRTNYVQTQAAALLGITRRILKYKMDKLRIPPAA
jgi:DNA-binding NtrC family response regulator